MQITSFKTVNLNKTAPTQSKSGIARQPSFSGVSGTDTVCFGAGPAKYRNMAQKDSAGLNRIAIGYTIYSIDNRNISQDPEEEAYTLLRKDQDPEGKAAGIIYRNPEQKVKVEDGVAIANNNDWTSARIGRMTAPRRDLQKDAS